MQLDQIFQTNQLIKFNHPLTKRDNMKNLTQTKKLKDFISHTEKRLIILEAKNDLTDGEYSEMQKALEGAKTELRK